MNQAKKVLNRDENSNKAYNTIGSVSFFKHIILVFISLLLVSLITICIVLRTQNSHLTDEILQLQSDLETVQLSLNKTIASSSSSSAPVTPDPSPEPIHVKESFPYQTMYPDLYCEKKQPLPTPSKTLYLTFDDGPSENTVKVLNILKKYNIKATFFVVGRDAPRSVELMKQIVAEGHSIGVHTYTHDYATIYASIEAYLADFKKEYDVIYNATGVKPTIFRFPGGSINSYDQNLYQPLIAEMLRRGFTYYDWNISSGDGASTTTSAMVKSNVLGTAAKLDHGIVLMHDSSGKSNTMAALEEVIVELSHKGFKFASINNEVMPITFLYSQ